MLNLNLEKKWFDMIASGEKREEYREITDYWIKRLFDNIEHFKKCEYHRIDRCPRFEKILFSNGYRKGRKQMIVSLINIRICNGKVEWGAQKNKLYFVLTLGHIQKLYE